MKRTRGGAEAHHGEHLRDAKSREAADVESEMAYKFHAGLEIAERSGSPTPGRWHSDATETCEQTAQRLFAAAPC